MITSALTPLPDGQLIPSLIADAGDQACWRYIDFFTSNIRNPNTRRAYARACQTFFAWCDERGLGLTTIRPYDVATYIESRGLTHSAPDVKQQLAAVRMLFDWLITGQVVPHNPPPPCAGPAAFDAIRRQPAYKAAMARGAVELWMPVLSQGVSLRIERARVQFREAREGLAPEGRKPASISLLERVEVREFVERMASEFQPIEGWMPWT
jgi:hypothetical protein